METYKDYLTKIYYDSAHPAPYSEEDKLFREVRKEGRHRISRNKIRNWLQEQEAFIFTNNREISFQNVK